jgi:integrase
MGRKRSKDFDLPPRMARKGANYYYVCNAPRKWIPLGSDLATAKRRWAEHDAPIRTESFTVASLVQKYVDRAYRPHSTATQYASYRRAIADAFPIPAEQLRSVHVALWRELPAQRARPDYTNGCIALVVASCRYGAELGLCQTLTVGKLVVSGRDRVLTPDEYRSIRTVAPDFLRTAMDIGFLTGARPCDLLALRWSQVGERIELRQKKTGTRQEFLLDGDIATVLQQARQRPIIGLYVVATDRGRPVSRNALSAAWRKACADAGVADAQFRDIRAMAAKAGKESGLDYQALLGHSSQAMSDHYIKGRQTIVATPVRRKL